MRIGELKKLKDDVEHLKFRLTMLQQEINGLKEKKKRKTYVVKSTRNGNKNRGKAIRKSPKN